MSAEITAILDFSRALRRQGLGADLRQRLAASSGLHPIGVRAMIAAWLAGLDEARLGAAVAAARGRRHDAPPARLHVVAPGNLFVATWQLVVEGLCLGSSVRVRVSERDVASVVVLQAALAEVAPALAGRVSWTRFDHGDDPAWATFLGGADAVVGQGSDVAMAALQARVSATRPGLPLRTHGHRLSIMASAGAPRGLEGVVRDVLLADGRGCMAPRLWVVCGGIADPERLAAEVAAACQAGAAALPAGRLPAGHDVAWRGHVEALRFDAALLGGRLAEGPGVAVVAGGALAASVDARWLTPAPRTIVMVAGPPVGDLATWLAPLRPHLSTGAVVSSGDADDAVGLQLAAAGCLRICDSGAMQSPPWSRTSEGEPLGTGWWPPEPR